jgi:hypothetical protein
MNFEHPLLDSILVRSLDDSCEAELSDVYSAESSERLPSSSASSFLLPLSLSLLLGGDLD